MQMRADDTVHALFKAVRHLERESHLFKGFVRFVAGNGVLAAQIEPKNFVLPLLAEHFCQRFPEERFLIHDQSHGVALVYQPYQYRICPVDELELPALMQRSKPTKSYGNCFTKALKLRRVIIRFVAGRKCRNAIGKHDGSGFRGCQLPGGGKKDKLLQEPLWKLKGFLPKTAQAVFSFINKFETCDKNERIWERYCE